MRKTWRAAVSDTKGNATSESNLTAQVCCTHGEQPDFCANLCKGIQACASVTAEEVATRIQKSLGGEWRQDSVDGIKAGDPSTPITGIVTTSLASITVMEQARRAGANMIVTTEPAFYNHADAQTLPGRSGPGTAAPVSPSPDPVFAGKAAYLRKHNLVVYRLHEHWRAHVPDPYSAGLSDVLGWLRFARDSDPRLLHLPEMTLTSAVAHVKQSLNVRGGMRVVGKPQLRIRNVGLLPGSTSIEKSVALLPQVDLLLAGEVREWEAVEYVRDAVDMGEPKALMLIGRVVSEDPGMKTCAAWLKSIVPEVPSTWVPAGDPYWRPTL